jgi:hypothetical protein
MHKNKKNSCAYYYLVGEEIDEKLWYYDVKKSIQYREYPNEASKSDRKTLRRIAMDYYLDEEVLYKRSFDGTFLGCSNEEEVRKALHEIDKGIGATHINRHMMTRKI